MTRILFFLAVALLVQLVREPASAAYKLEPISRVFAPSGSKATQSFEIVNSGAERIAISISFATLERDATYAESNRDAEDEFLAYPAQVILAPNTRQTVRVSWLGTATPTRELAYRIIVTQVPVALLDPSAAREIEPEGRMRIMLTYRGTLFIRPAGAAPKISVVATTTPGTITLENAGSAVGLVKDCAIRIAAGAGPSVALDPTVLAPLRNTRILAGSQRRYVVAWPASFTAVASAVRVTGTCTVQP